MELMNFNEILEVIDNNKFLSLFFVFWALCLLIIGVFLWLDPKQIIDEDNDHE